MDQSQSSSEKKQYVPPQVIIELVLETRAGSAA